MRWDRLFAELEQQSVDLEHEERDALVDDLRDEEWARTSWRDLLGGTVALDIARVGRLEGVVRLVNDRLVHLQDSRSHHVIDVEAIVTIVSTERRVGDQSRVAKAWTWIHALRALRDEGGIVRVVRTDGERLDGVVETVGQDHVVLRAEAGRTRIVPFAALAVVSGPT